jgi:hypothetical protein
MKVRIKFHLNFNLFYDFKIQMKKEKVIEKCKQDPIKCPNWFSGSGEHTTHPKK